MRTSRPLSKPFACLLVACALALASAYPVQHGSCARRRQRDHEQQYGYGGPHNEQYGNEQYGDGHGYGDSGPEHHQHGYDSPYGPGDATMAQQPADGATVDKAPTVAKVGHPWGHRHSTANTTSPNRTATLIHTTVLGATPQLLAQFTPTSY